MPIKSGHTTFNVGDILLNWDCNRANDVGIIIKRFRGKGKEKTGKDTKNILQFRVRWIKGGITVEYEWWRLIAAINTDSFRLLKKEADKPQTKC